MDKEIVLNTQVAFALLSVEEEVEFQRLVEAAKAEKRGEAEKVRESYIDERSKEIASKRSIPKEEARRTVVAAIAEKAELYPDFMLKLDKHGEVAVADVLANMKTYDGATLADPLEPDYNGGRNVAKLYANNGKPVIYSFAHGGKTYFLRTGKPRSCEEAWVLLNALDPKDPGAWFEEKVLEALVTLYTESKPNFERAIFKAKRGKANIKDLREEVRKHALKISTSKKQTHQTHQTHTGAKESILTRAGHLPETVDEAERILLREESDFYQRGGQLVRTCVRRAETVCGVTRPEGAVTIIAIDVDYLLDRLNRAIEWRREKHTGAEVIEIRCDAPRKVATALLARRGHWLAKPLTGVINAPTLRPDGSILDKPGYDAATGLLFVVSSGLPFLPVPERPSRDDAVRALAELKAVIKDFPFAEDYDCSAMLSALLTATVRHSLPAAPMHTFSAPQMASGKSLLADVVALIATGAPATVMSYTEDSDEMRKRIISTLIQGDLVINLDNIEAPFASQTLCTVLTQEEFTDRLLGTNKTVTAPTNCCWLATGNNLLIQGDLITRVIPCMLDPRCENPESREFDRNLYQWIPQNRPRLVRATLIVLRAYHVADRPRQNIKNFARFEEWSHWVRSALVWLGEPDPCLRREKLTETDPVTKALRNLLAAWYEVYGETTAITKQAIADANKATTEIGGAICYEHESLRDALMEVCGGRDGKLNGRRLGNYLERYERRIVAGRRFERAGNRQGYLCWRSAVIDEAPLNPTGEFGEFNSPRGNSTHARANQSASPEDDDSEVLA